jgi:hypothetical protein
MQYISNLWYYFDYNVDASNNYNPYHLARSCPEEQFEVVVDGRKVLMYNGVDTNARKLALLSDLAGECCIPGLSSYYYGVGRTMPLALDASGTGSSGDPHAFGLTNPNTKVLYNNILSYGMVKLEQFVQIDLAIYYSYKVEGSPTSQYPAFVRTMAEVLRSYNKRIDQVSNVTQKPGVVNMM